MRHWCGKGYVEAFNPSFIDLILFEEEFFIVFK